MFIDALNPQFHDGLDELYASEPYLWENSITIRSADCYCKYPYSACWEYGAEMYIDGCETDNSYSMDLTVDAMSKWTKARIEGAQVFVSCPKLKLLCNNMSAKL